MSQAMVAITSVELSKKIVDCGDSFTISVGVLELTPDIGKRLPMRLGSGERFVHLPDVIKRRLPMRLGEKGDIIL